MGQFDYGLRMPVTEMEMEMSTRIMLGLRMKRDKNDAALVDRNTWDATGYHRGIFPPELNIS